MPTTTSRLTKQSKSLIENRFRNKSRIGIGKRRYLPQIPKCQQCTVDTTAVEPPGRGLFHYDAQQNLPSA